MKTCPTNFARLTLALTALAFNLSVAQQAKAGSFTNTGSMSAARYLHTATLLLDGKVLAAGGIVDGDNSHFTNSAELYDPATGTWTATGAMNTARQSHTATLLPSGKVLVAGSVVAPFLTSSSTETYDPATRIWTTNSPMFATRGRHTATLLPNGLVLVAGGTGFFRTPNFAYNGTLSLAELFNPITGTWTNTGEMSIVRQWHTATLLPNGKVLVAGGYDGDAHSLAELYDPTTGTWTNTGAMTISRYLHRATLLSNGKVLVTGGFDSSFHPTNSAELYDSTTGTWTNTAPLNAARAYPASILLPNGKVLVVGGATNITEIYDPAIETWTVTGAMITNRSYLTATLLTNGNVLVTGGSPDFGFRVLSSAELYDSSNMTVTAFNLINSTKLPGNAFQFAFTNALNESFSVLSTTNLSLPLSNWTVLSGVTEFPPGQYKFTDLQATNNPQRFYRIRSP